MLDFVNRKTPFVNQRRALPAQPQGQRCPARRQLDQSIGIIELDIKLVSLESAIVGHGQPDKPVAEILCDICATEREHKIRSNARPRPE